MRWLGWLSSLAALACVTTAPLRASAQGPVAVDAVAYRFASPETGGWATPRYISERTLAFEAALEALNEQLPPDVPFQDRHVRAALDHHVAEEMLASMPIELPRDALSALVRQLELGLRERINADALRDVAAKQTIGDGEIRAMLERQARAALYVDKMLSPILHPSEEQLREVYRTSAHPFRGRPYDQARAPLERWFIGERLRIAEAAFYQSARSRVRIVAAASPR